MKNPGPQTSSIIRDSQTAQNGVLQI